jgi:hypothetical protein
MKTSGIVDKPEVVRSLFGILLGQRPSVSRIASLTDRNGGKEKSSFFSC